jgi:hypothetical protein
MHKRRPSPRQDLKAVELDAELGSQVAELAPMVGVDDAAALARLGLRQIFRKIKARELINVDGQLVSPQADG